MIVYKTCFSTPSIPSIPALSIGTEKVHMVEAIIGPQLGLGARRQKTKQKKKNRDSTVNSIILQRQKKTKNDPDSKEGTACT